MRTRVTANEVQAKAQEYLNADPAAEWAAEEKARRDRGLSESQIEKARQRHLNAVASGRDLAKQVASVNLARPLPMGAKEWFRRAAARWFGLDVEVTFPDVTPRLAPGEFWMKDSGIEIRS
ncbi:MAG: hypothetical protein JRD89_08790 [Deltaproteobacteria bacterium]|nr:hypothetical protein [Deltaproteobacteria bacterium]